MFQKRFSIGVVFWGLFILFVNLLGPTQGISMDFPTKPIELILPYAPGGITDIQGRLYSTKCEEYLGQPMVVLNKPGATGALGTEFVIKAKPDGYTLCFISIGTAGTLKAMNPKLSYDPVKDLTAICRASVSSNIVIVKGDSPLDTLEKLIGYGKKNPGRLNYGSAGVGSSGHFMGELFQQAAGFRMVHVPYKGSAPSLMALLGGHIDLTFSNHIEAVEQIRARAVIPLVVSSPKRIVDLPNVPSMVEKGYPNAVFEAWGGVAGPAGMPRPVVEKLSGYFQKVLALPNVQKKMQELGMTPAYLGPDEFGEYVRKNLEIYIDVAKRGNIRVEE